MRVPTICAHGASGGDRAASSARDPLASLTPAMPSRSSASGARKPASQARLERENAHDEIYEKIYVAILEHRLHPGTKLVEERLAEIFGVSRARVREVLARLAHEQ